MKRARRQSERIIDSDASGVRDEAAALAPPRYGVDFLDRSIGLPADLKEGIESLSGLSMDAVTVHYNSPRPARVDALAYAQGADIHLAPGQERHLPHEAWHLVQQAQGRVKPTLQTRDGVPVNDEKALEREADRMGAKAARAGGQGRGQATGSPRPTAAGAPIQRILNLELDQKQIKVKTEEGLKNHKDSITAAAGRLYPEHVQDIWKKLKSWASEWDSEETEYPGPDEYYQGYEAAVHAAAKTLEIAKEKEEENFDPDLEILPREILELKKIWAEISRDPTEGHEYSENLTRLGKVLSDKLEDLRSRQFLGAINQVLPGLSDVNDRFLLGKYDCHQNAAKAARKIFGGFKFRSCCVDEGISAIRVDKLVAEWDAAAFSTLLGE